MQRIDEDCQVRLAGVARTDEDGSGRSSTSALAIGPKSVTANLMDSRSLGLLTWRQYIRLLSLPPPVRRFGVAKSWS